VAVLVFAILFIFLVQGFGNAALVRAIADGYAGKPVGILASYMRLKDAGWRLCFALLWMMLLFTGFVIFTFIPCVGWLGGPGLLLFLFWIVLPMLAPVVVIENRGPLASAGRAWDLGRTRFWWLIGYALILALLNLLVIFGPSVLIGSILRFFLLAHSDPLNPAAGRDLLVLTVVQSLVNMLGTILVVPLQFSAMTVAYFDLRVRSEGLDLAVQASAPKENAPLELPDAAAMRSPTRLITGTDVGNFILLSLGFFAVYALLILAFLAVFALIGAAATGLR
jgi:hypothetical protein